MKRTALPLLALVNLLFFWPVMFHGRVFSSHDVVFASYPWRAGRDPAHSPRDLPRNRLLSDPATASQTVLRNLRSFPRGFFWDRAIASGAPGPLNIVQGNLSPFFWLPAVALPEAAIETGILFLKLNAGFLFAWIFLRSRSFSETAAAAGAAAWGWTSAQSVWWLWMQTSVSVFFPLLLWAVDRAFTSGKAARAVAAAGLVFLGALAGGFPHWLIYGGIAAALYYLFRLPEEGVRGGLRAVWRLGASIAIAGAILLPAILFSARFLRESGQLEIRKGRGTQFPIPLRQLRLMLVPEYSGNSLDDDYRGVGIGPFDNYVETAAGVGPFALGAAALALANRRRRRFTAYAATLGLVIGLPAYAGGPLLRFAGSLPGLSLGVFERAKILIVFAVSLAAAAGVEALEEAFRGRPAELRLVSLIPYAMAVPLVFLAARYYPALRPADAVFRDTPGIRRLRSLEAAGPSRFAATGWTLIPNVAEAMGLEDIRSHLIHEAAYRDLLDAADRDVYGRYGTFLILAPGFIDLTSPVLDLLNVGAIAAPPGVESPNAALATEEDPGPLPLFPRGAPAGAGGLTKIYSGDDLTIFARPGAFPRFFAVSRAAPGGVREARASSRETLRTTAFVSPQDLGGLRGSLGSGADPQARVRIADYRPERFAVAVESAAPVLLASSQKVFDPYWRAFVDGAPARLYRCDGLFFGALVPPGRHVVEGRFVLPAAEKAVSALGILALAAAGAAAGLGRGTAGPAC